MRECDCEGCRCETWECFIFQNMEGVVAGLEFWKGHCFFFAIDDKTGEWIVPFYDPRDMVQFHKEINK